MFIHKFLSTALGIGHIGKGAGTYAAIATCICWHLFQSPYTNPYLWPVLFTMLIVMIGVMSADRVEEIWGKDHNRVVIDEVAGMCITLLFVPLKWEYTLIGLILFRFFDILKPLYIRKLEVLPGGWGVMADDVLAGIYANLILQLVVVLELF
ncbi:MULTISPECIES: phosphatidylglycerophosphatase A [unclassified Pedobacter]|uniref:phosphatidylglycerophosphatase A family protein n=1 Tax=unclassified Pedobacter TaxID=2628915 RepID=UPI00181DDCC1|nr:phosphatidylglycerophosphatase A [Pedobacter sp. SG918]NII83781.1 phosphatidylglycerophosphatase A [Pedobacter sp. SG908]NMN37638.1 phosphatidylglycerophosphatase A [Pedobacter sp. SG918]